MTTNSTDSSPYPYDFDKLDKGSIIPPEELERIFDVKRHDRRFGMEAMFLCGRVELELRVRGIEATACMDKDALKVLTDAEAVLYHHRAFERGVRKLAKSHAGMMRVDTSRLSQEEKAHHDSLVNRQAPQLLALRQARQRLYLQAYTRKNPPLNGGQGVARG